MAKVISTFVKFFVCTLTQVLANLGLILSEDMRYYLELFAAAPEVQPGVIPAMILTGVPGAGKTSAAEAFALAAGAEKLYYQCMPCTGSDEMLGKANLAAVIQQQYKRAIADGILIKAAKLARSGKVDKIVLIIDELDKAIPQTDNYLLDFLQSRRITDTNNELLVIPDNVKMWCFITTNDNRDLEDALISRSRMVEVERPGREIVAKVLDIKENATLLDIYEANLKLSIRQLKAYIADGGDPYEIDWRILKQYCRLKDVDQTVLENLCYCDIGGSVETNITSLRYNSKRIVALQGYVFDKIQCGDETRIRIYFENILELARLYRAFGYDDLWVINGCVTLDGLRVAASCPNAAIYKAGGETFITDRKIAGKWVLNLSQYIEENEEDHTIFDLLREIAEKEDLNPPVPKPNRYSEEESAQQASHLLEKMGLADLL